MLYSSDGLSPRFYGLRKFTNREFLSDPLSLLFILRLMSFMVILREFCRLLLDYTVKTTQFAYSGNYYQQVFGTAMGSPISAVVANMVMENVEQMALATSPVKPFFWKRYVNDFISAVSGGVPPIAFKFSRAVYPIHP